MEKISGSLDERIHIKSDSDGHLQRTVENRHIQLIAIGGAIGTGLFMGSGKVIALAGTSTVLVYAILGFFLLFVMRAMGELLLSNLRFKSFADIVATYLGRDPVESQPLRGTVPPGRLPGSRRDDQLRRTDLSCLLGKQWRLLGMPHAVRAGRAQKCPRDLRQVVLSERAGIQPDVVRHLHAGWPHPAVYHSRGDDCLHPDLDDLGDPGDLHLVHDPDVLHRLPEAESGCAPTVPLQVARWLAVITLVFLVFVLCLLALKPDTRTALYFMPLWFIFLLIAYSRSKTSSPVVANSNP